MTPGETSFWQRRADEILAEGEQAPGPTFDNAADLLAYLGTNGGHMDTSFEFEGSIDEPPAKAKKPRAGRWDAFIAAATAALDKQPFGNWLSWKMADQKAAESAERAALKADPALGVLFETTVSPAAAPPQCRLALRYVNGKRKMWAPKAAEPAASEAT